MCRSAYPQMGTQAGLHLKLPQKFLVQWILACLDVAPREKQPESVGGQLWQLNS